MGWRNYGWLYIGCRDVGWRDVGWLDVGCGDVGWIDIRWLDVGRRSVRWLDVGMQDFRLGVIQQHGFGDGSRCRYGRLRCGI